MRTISARIARGVAVTIGVLSLAALASPRAAFSHTVTISDVTGTWENAAPPGVVTYGGNGTAHPTARWGTPAGANGQSGYNFDAATPPNIDVAVPPSPSSEFTLGNFTHVNQPIFGNSITGIQLLVQAAVSVDSGPASLLSFVFDFTHDETPNSPPCPYGPATLTGINQNGCADRVAVAYNTTSDFFNVGGDQYTLNILGFQIGGVTQTQFLTEEDADNTAPLIADVTLRSTLVPEPSSIAVFGAGLLAFGLFRRRSRRLDA